MTRIRVPPGMKIDLWAAEPMLANPVVFCIDAQNRIYVAETFRMKFGVPDIRGIMSWLDDDLACRTVADRVAMMKRRLGKKISRLQRPSRADPPAGRHEGRRQGRQVHRLRRRLSQHRIRSRGRPAGAGKDVYYTCIPDLWLLRDNKDAGKADERTKLSSGYGVHIGYIGHDLHGLILGPDGKLYFSIGDRGLNVKTRDRHLFYPDQGSVLRCNLDGSELEVFATGLRNPQELAFDEHGNLFTCDNNSDGGDRARWTYLVEGGDCGWRIGYQFGGVQSNRGPWNAEKLWHPHHPEQAAWIVPPIANIADGPAGLAYYPGLGLPERYDGHFFLADFRGGPANSGIRSLANKPRGAGFEMTDQHEFLWSVLATDVDFGMDGALYVSDWVNGWDLTGKGRLWKVSDPKYANSPAQQEVKKLMAEGMTSRKPAELARLLAHKDMRVRREAQFALADRGKSAIPVLAGATKSDQPQLARLHAIWGLGQIGRTRPARMNPFSALLDDKDAEVRAQAAKVLGDGKVGSGAPRNCCRCWRTPSRACVSSRLRRWASSASKDAFAPAGGPDPNATPTRTPGCAMRPSSPWRRAATRLLCRSAATDASVAVRRAALLAYRRQAHAEVARFLADVDGELVLEAARAINDVPIEPAMPKLAALIGRRGMSDALGYRVLNANFRLGKAENARAVAGFAARSEGRASGCAWRPSAMLGMWAKPPGRDRIMGLWRPLEPRPESMAADALRPALGGIFTGPDKVRQEAAKVAAQLGIKEIGPTLFEMVADAKRPAQVRVDTLMALAALKDERLDKALKLALADAEPRLRGEARRVLAQKQPRGGLASLAAALDKGATVEKQLAFEVLGEMKGNQAAQALLGKWLDRLLAGKVPAEAAARSGGGGRAQSDAPTSRRSWLATTRSGPKREPFGKWRDSLVGGDAESGRRIFLYKSEVSCLRCHKAAGEGVGEVGPDLTGIGGKQKRDYLLESIVEPNKQIAKGFETVELTLASGQIRSGVLKARMRRKCG